MRWLSIGLVMVLGLILGIQEIRILDISNRLDAFHAESSSNYDVQSVLVVKSRNDFSKQMEAESDRTSRVEEKLDKIVNLRTGNVEYWALDPKFIREFQELSQKVRMLEWSLNQADYGFDSGGSRERYDAQQAFDGKIHAAKFMLRSGNTEAARALFLSALAERNIPIHACWGPLEGKAFSPYYEAPRELLPLLDGSPYQWEIVRKETWPGSTSINLSYTEEVVMIGVGQFFIKGC